MGWAARSLGGRAWSISDVLQCILDTNSARAVLWDCQTKNGDDECVQHGCPRLFYIEVSAMFGHCYPGSSTSY